MPLILVTGPARSGKSAWAEAQACATQLPVTYVATGVADPHDREWQARLDQHRQRRPAAWQTLEVPVALAAAIRDAQGCCLVDSLGTWVANMIEQDQWPEAQAQFLDALRQTQATIICVSEEVGWGVVPAYPLGRTFRDRLGELQQQVAALSDSVYLVIAGLALDLKRLSSTVQ